LNTYTQEQVSKAKELLTDIWGDQPAYKELPSDSKDRLAEIVLRAFKIKPKE
jgi:hypothetical protein